MTAAGAESRPGRCESRPGRLIWLLAISACAWSSGSWASAPRQALHTVDSVDLRRYAGKWFEVARLPNWFQRRCVADTTATYALRPDGEITVLNECRLADGRIESITGTAKRATRDGPASKLRVSFFWPFYGNYWIIDLDAGYQWAVVGEPRRHYLWVLSRSARLDAGTFEAILRRVRSQGYDLSRLVISAR